MTVTLRPYRGRNGAWEADIRVQLPHSTTVIRERRKAPQGSKRAAMRWAKQRESELMLGHVVDQPPPQPKPEAQPRHRESKPAKSVPTLEQFIPRYIRDYCEANRNKPSTLDAKRSLLRHYIVPQLGKCRLDEISHVDIQRLKHALSDKHPKYVNNTLSVLNTMLRAAAEWGVIDGVPVRGQWLKASHRPVGFFEFEDYERLVVAADELGHRELLTVLLGGEAGLRRGEMLGLEWTDLDLGRGIVTVARSTWKGEVTATKGGRIRTVPMTRRLLQASRSFYEVSDQPTVLHADKGGPATAKKVTTWLQRAQARAGLPTRKGAHTLRHTFCSHLAMRGAPPRAIQELAGHRHITTTERYMHLSPAALSGAIRLLEQPPDT